VGQQKSKLCILPAFKRDQVQNAAEDQLYWALSVILLCSSRKMLEYLKICNFCLLPHLIIIMINIPYHNQES